MGTAGNEPVGASASGGSGVGWHALMVWGAIVLAVVLLVSMVFIGFIPPLVIAAVLFVIGALVARRKPKVGAIVLAVFSVLFLALNAPFIAPGLAVPASTADFLLTVLFLVINLTVLIAAIAVIRRPTVGASPGAGLLARVALGLLVVALAVAVVARATYDAPSVQAGDVRLVTEDFDFSKTSLPVETGEVSVFVENRDPTLHTFTVEELDVDLQVPANSSGRVAFDAPDDAMYCVANRFPGPPEPVVP